VDEVPEELEAIFALSRKRFSKFPHKIFVVILQDIISTA